MPPLPHPLTILTEHPPAGYPAGQVTGQLHASGWEAGWADVGSEVHRHVHLQHGYAIPEGVELLKVWVSDNPTHRHLPGVLGGLVQLGASQQDLVVFRGMGFAGGGKAHCHHHL